MDIPWIYRCQGENLGDAEPGAQTSVTLRETTFSSVHRAGNNFLFRIASWRRGSLPNAPFPQCGRKFMRLSNVVPASPDGHQWVAKRIRSRTAHGLKVALEARNRIKISRLGTYSTQRVEALESYCQKTSPTRILIFCALTPWPALLLTLLTELIPVEDPAIGWKLNYGVWIRFFILITSASARTLCQLRPSIAGLSYWKIALVGIGTGAGSSVAMMVWSSVWVFPLPFSFLLMTAPMQILFLGCFSAATYQRGSNNAVTSIENPGKRKFNLKLEKPLKQKLLAMLSQSLLAIFYITFGVIFTNCSPKQQVGLLFFMPVLKLALKHLVARLVSENESSIPAVVAFSVDVFNGLFTSICMQASASWWTSLAMIAINSIRAVFSFWEINRSMRKLRELERQNQNKTKDRKQVWGTLDSSGSRRSSSIITSAKWQAHSQKMLVTKVAKLNASSLGPSEFQRNPSPNEGDFVPDALSFGVPCTGRVYRKCNSSAVRGVLDDPLPAPQRKVLPPFAVSYCGKAAIHYREHRGVRVG
jgi:hypothetical protein